MPFFLQCNLFVVWPCSVEMIKSSSKACCWRATLMIGVLFWHYLTYLWDLAHNSLVQRRGRYLDLLPDDLVWPCKSNVFHVPCWSQECTEIHTQEFSLVCQDVSNIYTILVDILYQVKISFCKWPCWTLMAMLVSWTLMAMLVSWLARVG